MAWLTWGDYWAFHCIGLWHVVWVHLFVVQIFMTQVMASIEGVSEDPGLDWWVSQPMWVSSKVVKDLKLISSLLWPPLPQSSSFFSLSTIGGFPPSVSQPKALDPLNICLLSAAVLIVGPNISSLAMDPRSTHPEHCNVGWIVQSPRMECWVCFQRGLAWEAWTPEP